MIEENNLVKKFSNYLRRRKIFLMILSFFVFVGLVLVILIQKGYSDDIASYYPWKNYQNDEYGYSIKYPYGYTVEIINDVIVITDNYHEIFIEVVESDNKGKAKSLNEYIAYESAKERPAIASILSVFKTKSKIVGTEVSRSSLAVAACVGCSAQRYNSFIYFSGNDEVGNEYFIKFSHFPDDFKYNEGTFKDIVRTFKLLHK